MLKRILPIFLLFTTGLYSCGSQQSSETSSDTTALTSSEIEASESAPSDTIDGNTDGDIFVTDALQNAISNETGIIDTVSEYGTQEQEEHDEMVGPQETLAEVCGFSPDGKYFAFMQIDRGDGYDDPDANVYVIDVARNEWATRPANFTGDRESDNFDEKVGAVRDNMLKKYGVTRQKNPGYEYGFIGVNPNNVVIINEDRYVLDFKSNNGMIELRVKGKDKDVLLQKDSKVPASRGAVRRIRLNKAFVLGDRIAVLVEYDGDIQTGFENYRYYMRKNIVVTGVVPK